MIVLSIKVILTFEFVFVSIKSLLLIESLMFNLSVSSPLFTKASPSRSVIFPIFAKSVETNIKKYSNDSMKFCADLLESKGVALVPGLAFGMEGYVRLSFATSMKAIEDGINRIKEFVENR